MGEENDCGVVVSGGDSSCQERLQSTLATKLANLTWTGAQAMHKTLQLHEGGGHRVWSNVWIRKQQVEIMIAGFEKH